METYSHMVYLQLQPRIVTPPTTAEFKASAVSRSNCGNPPAVKSVTPLAAVLLLTDSGFNF